ncbi:MAG: type II toxin-antitoxin system VapC family toxin [Candidatus Poribacteria bacterium]|nr:type II toxin-antitoxin system VapC family toxin [Candidatus Poribacteria bacterium]
MNHKTIPVVQHNFTSKDKLFLDANIWLYLYCPQGSRGHSWVSTYSDVFDRILDASSRIYIDVLVVSEFINTFAKQEYELAKKGLELAKQERKITEQEYEGAKLHLRSFKDFRNTPDFELIAEGIAAAVKQIMKHCSRVESCFTTLETDQLLVDYESGGFDFNDQMIAEICKCNEFTLITNDSDFKTQEIPILTANPSLLTT